MPYDRKVVAAAFQNADSGLNAALYAVCDDGMVYAHLPTAEEGETDWVQLKPVPGTQAYYANEDAEDLKEETNAIEAQEDAQSKLIEDMRKDIYGLRYEMKYLMASLREYGYPNTIKLAQDRIDRSVKKFG